MEKSFVFKFMGLNFDLTGIIGSTLMALTVFFICFWLARKVEMKPNKRQNVFEYLLEFTNGIVKDNVSDVDAQKHLSLYAFVLFLFIWFMNQLGMFLEVKVDDWVFIKSPTADPVATMSLPVPLTLTTVPWPHFLCSTLSPVFQPTLSAPVPVLVIGLTRLPALRYVRFC